MKNNPKKLSEEKFMDELSNMEILNLGGHMADITATVSGAILRKAELDGNFDKVYTQVIQKITQFEFINNGDENVLEIFGVSGG